MMTVVYFLFGWQAVIWVHRNPFRWRKQSKKEIFQRRSILLNELSYYSCLVSCWIAIFKRLQGLRKHLDWFTFRWRSTINVNLPWLSIQNSINLYYSCKVFTHYKSVSAVRIAPTLIEWTGGKRSFTSVERLFLRYPTVQFRVFFRIHHSKSPSENSPPDTFISKNNSWV